MAVPFAPFLSSPATSTRVEEQWNQKEAAKSDMYYTRYQNHGVETPKIDENIRDWFRSIQLDRNDSYLIHPDVKRIYMGVGWRKGGDLDGSAAMFDASGMAVDVVWYRQLRSQCHSVQHSGDNMTGEGNGDDERIQVELESVPLHIHHILFSVSVYSYNLSLREVREAYVRMLHGNPEYQDHVMCAYSLTNMEGHAMLMGLLTRKGAYWNFRALGLPATGRTVLQLLKNRDNLRCLLDNPSVAPTLLHVKISVVGGRGLAAKDSAGLFGNATSDPYYIIKYKRKTYKSEYRTKTLSPTWRPASFDLGIMMETERKAVKITLYDYDTLSADDFLGMIRIPANAFYNAGPGEHQFSFELGPTKDKRYRHEDVTGDIFINVMVTEVCHSNRNRLKAGHTNGVPKG